MGLIGYVAAVGKGKIYTNSYLEAWREDATRRFLAKWENNIRIDLKDICVTDAGMDSSDSESVSVTCSCKHANKTSCFVKYWAAKRLWASYSAQRTLRFKCLRKIIAKSSICCKGNCALNLDVFIQCQIILRGFRITCFMSVLRTSMKEPWFWTNKESSAFDTSECDFRRWNRRSRIENIRLTRAVHEYKLVDTQAEWRTSKKSNCCYRAASVCVYFLVQNANMCVFASRE